MVETLKAVKFLFTAPLILLILFVINLMTSPGHWWVQWAALGLGIAWFFSLLRVIRAVIVAGGLAALGTICTTVSVRYSTPWRSRPGSRHGRPDVSVITTADPSPIDPLARGIGVANAGARLRRGRELSSEATIASLASRLLICGRRGRS